MNPPDPFGIEAGAHLVSVKRARSREPGPPLTSSEEASRYLGGLARSPVERVVVVPVDSQNRPLGAVIASQGTLNESMVHPREVFAPAIEARAAAIIMAHNHPSGGCSPSEADWSSTSRVMRSGELLGIPLLDHVLVCSRGALSLRSLDGARWRDLDATAKAFAGMGERRARYKTSASRRKNPRLYHRTTKKAASAISRSRAWRSRKWRDLPVLGLRDPVWFSNRKSRDALARVYGDSVVSVVVPKQLMRPRRGIATGKSNERYYVVSAAALRGREVRVERRPRRLTRRRRTAVVRCRSRRGRRG